MKRFRHSTAAYLAIGVFFLIGCGPTSTPVPSTATTAPPQPSLTPEPSATQAPLPSLTPTPTALPTIPPLPQQWNGTYTYPTGSRQNISLLIEESDGAAFTGKMVWQSFRSFKGAILRMNGQFVYEFGDEFEQTRWNNLEDYRSGDRTGTWLKWTETEIIDGSNYTVNGWYYAHIRDDGIMVAVYFFNDTELVPDAGTFVLEQVLP
jgi:hypothetical protein